jgi:hypothetical protein
MDNERFELLLREVWNDVFHMFDAEPGVRGEFAGMLAQAASDAVAITFHTAMHAATREQSDQS